MVISESLVYKGDWIVCKGSKSFLYRGDGSKSFLYNGDGSESSVYKGDGSESLGLLKFIHSLEKECPIC